MQYRGVQCLRAIAALLVMWSHVRFAGDFRGVRWLDTGVGALGVDMFFVVSGFVIALNARSLHFAWAPFLARRITRVVPLYWALSLPLALTAWAAHRLEWGGVANTLLFLPLFDREVFSLPVHGYGWTLCFEMWFYLAFAACLGALRSRAPLALPMLLASGCAAVALMPPGGWYLPRFLFNPLVLEFCAGMLVCRFAERLGLRLLMIAGLFLLPWAAMALLLEELANFPRVLAHTDWAFARAAAWGGLGVVLLVMAVAAENIGVRRWPRTLVRLGDASYSLYLIQPYSLWLALQLGTRLHLPPALCGLAFAGGTVLLGLLLSDWVEVPLTRLLRRRRAPPPFADTAIRVVRPNGGRSEAAAAPRLR